MRRTRVEHPVPLSVEEIDKLLAMLREKDQHRTRLGLRLKREYAEARKNDDRHLEQIIAEVRDGLEGVTPGPWHEGVDGNRRIYGTDGRGNDSGLIASFVRRRDLSHIARCSPDNIAAILSALSEATSERDAANVYKAKAISRGKLLERFRDHIQNMCDHATDEGDRVYFGSTNDLDELRAIAREMEDWKWDAIMRERPETDPYALCHELRTRAETAERKLAEAEQNYEIAAHERDAITSEVAELQRKLAEAVEVLALYGMAAHTDVTMEGVHLIGVNRSAFKRAWDADRTRISGEQP